MEGQQDWRPRHNVCSVIYRHNEATLEMEMLVLKSRTLFRGRWSDWRLKFPGGNQEGPNESVEGTRDREIWQETHLACRKSRQIMKLDHNPLHVKYGYLISYDDCFGELRKGILNDNGEDQLQPPEWVPISILKTDLFPGHQPLLLSAMRALGLC